MKTTTKLAQNSTLKDLQEITKQVYGISNDRFFNTWEICSNQEKFMMRALKGIRKGDFKKLRDNIVITTGWFFSIMNRLHIDVQDAVWKRFPGLCSYCGQCPCVCKKIKIKKRVKITRQNKNRPRTLKQFQKMFSQIYPPSSRTLEHAGIHLAEEDGEFNEAIQSYYGSHSKRYFKDIIEEAADYFSCLMGVFNSAGFDFEKEMIKFYVSNCHICHQAPCVCNFKWISDFKS